MTVNESQEAFGSFRVRLRGKPEAQPGRKPLPATPQEILDQLDDSNWLGHVIITDVWVDPNEVDPLTVARYTGVYRERSFSEDAKEIGGSGLVYWLGDGMQRGPELIEAALELDSLTLEQGLQQLLPDAVQLGNVVGAVGTQSARYLFITRRRAIEDWCSLFSAEYEITPQGLLNAGPASSLYSTFNDPNTLIKRQGAKPASDIDLKSLPTANAVFGADAVNYATRVIALTQIEDERFLEGSADLAVPTTYRDLHGNLVTITDVNVESTLDAFNVDARAAARLAQISEPRNTIELSTARYDVEGTIKVGDSVWVWDPESGLYDLTNKIVFAGEDYFPGKLRVVGLTWPITKGMGVYFRRNTAAGETYDLTPYVLWESGSTQVEVGAFSRSLIPPSTQPLGPIVAPVVNTNDPPSQPSAPTVSATDQILHIVVSHDLQKAGGGAMEEWTAFLKVFASTTSGFTPGPTNYIGRIEVSEAQVTLGTDVIGVFELDNALEHYFKVQPVGTNGKEGPASAQASASANLIPSAAIINLVADKIAAGTITASIEILSPHIVGGILETQDASTGNQRVALEEGDPDRAKFYTGESDEGTPGSIASLSDGTGSTVRLYTVIESPRTTLETTRRAIINLATAEAGGGNEPEIQLSTVTEAGGVGALIRVGETFLSLNENQSRVDLDTDQVRVRHTTVSGAGLYLQGTNHPDGRSVQLLGSTSIGMTIDADDLVHIEGFNGAFADIGLPFGHVTIQSGQSTNPALHLDTDPILARGGFVRFQATSTQTRLFTHDGVLGAYVQAHGGAGALDGSFVVDFETIGVRRLYAGPADSSRPGRRIVEILN